jgi:glucose-1-phosphate thymidylyltransferase
VRLISVLPSKGIIVVPDSAAWTGPWLSATRRPSLQRVANRPIVCHVLDAMLDAGIAEVAVLSPQDAIAEISECIGAEGPDGIAVTYLLSDRRSGAEHEHESESELAAAARFADGQACVLHRANGLLGTPLTPHLEHLQEQELTALLLVPDSGADKRLRLVTQSPERQSPEREDRDPGSSLPATGFAGVCLLGAGALERLAATAPSASLRDFSALAMHLSGAGAGATTEVRVVRRWRHFAGDVLDLLDMNRTMLDALDPDSEEHGHGHGNRFEGPVSIHPTASVTSSIIIGPVIVGADALIADSYIGPHTSIAERVRIEGAELERSIVLADASVLHVGGRLVASIVGREARIFRDFSMPRAMRLQVGDGDEVALC